MHPETSRMSSATTARIALLIILRETSPIAIGHTPGCKSPGQGVVCSKRRWTARVYILDAKFLCNQSHTGTELSWTFERIIYPSPSCSINPWWSSTTIGRMIILGQSSSPRNDSSLLIVTSMQRFTHHWLRQAYSKAKEKSGNLYTSPMGSDWSG